MSFFSFLEYVYIYWEKPHRDSSYGNCVSVSMVTFASCLTYNPPTTETNVTACIAVSVCNITRYFLPYKRGYCCSRLKTRWTSEQLEKCSCIYHTACNIRHWVQWLDWLADVTVLCMRCFETMISKCLVCCILSIVCRFFLIAQAPSLKLGAAFARLTVTTEPQTTPTQ